MTPLVVTVGNLCSQLGDLDKCCHQVLPRKSRYEAGGKGAGGGEGQAYLLEEHKETGRNGENPATRKADAL